jgi:hypothetical protein
VAEFEGLDARFIVDGGRLGLGLLCSGFIALRFWTQHIPPSGPGLSRTILNVGLLPQKNSS